MPLRLFLFAFIILALSVAFGALALGTTVDLRFWPLTTTIHVPLVAGLLGGVVAGALGALLWRELHPKAERDAGEQPLPWSHAALAALALLALAAVFVGEWTFGQAAIVVLAGSIALLAAFQAFDLLTRGDGIELQSHWGGLGGGMGGWRLSPAAVLLLVAFASMGTAVAVSMKSAPPTPPKTSQSEGSAPTPAPAGSGAAGQAAGGR